MVFKNRDIQDSCFIFIAGAALLWYSLSEHYKGPGVEWKMSPSLFPALVSVLLLLLSAPLLLGGLRQIRGERPARDAKSAVKTGPVLISAALSAAYYFLLRFITFIPSTVLFLAALMYLLGERRYWLIALTAVAGSLAVYAFFGLALGVRLP
jgi:putative tricarboxylic transport membrane protein